MGTLQNTSDRLTGLRRLVPFAGVGAFLGLWMVAASVSPLPLGARFVVGGGSSLRTEAVGQYEFGVYEVVGEGAARRARETAEKAGFRIVQADDGAVTYQRDDTYLYVYPGRFREVRALADAGERVDTEPVDSAAVVQITQPSPRWLGWR